MGMRVLVFGGFTIAWNVRILTVAFFCDVLYVAEYDLILYISFLLRSKSRSYKRFAKS